MPYSKEVQYARLMRPFPYKRLADALYHVSASAHLLDKELFKILTDPPTTPEAWCQALQRVDGLLMSLMDDAGEAREPIRGMYDAADSDFEVAVKAIQAIGRGLAELEADNAS